VPAIAAGPSSGRLPRNCEVIMSEQERSFAGLIARAYFVLCKTCPREDRQATDDENVAARRFASRGWRQRNCEGRIYWFCPECAGS
jgi:hypothetical protein